MGLFVKTKFNSDLASLTWRWAFHASVGEEGGRRGEREGGIGGGGEDWREGGAGRRGTGD